MGGREAQAKGYERLLSVLYKIGRSYQRDINLQKITIRKKNG